MIELKNVSKSYDGKTNAVDNVTITIPDGKIFGFLGPNGAGKTTTLKMITGILSADSGTINIGGYDIKDEPIKAKMSFSYVPDEPDIFPRLKGIEYLNFIGDIYKVPVSQRIEKIKYLSEEFGLDEVLRDRIQSYSHGMKQKLILTGALLHNPDHWILDEPMTGLDPKSSFILKEMMREHADNGKTVFFSTHVLDVAEKVCDHIAIIDKGAILFNGTVNEMRDKLKSSQSLEAMFLELTEGDKKW